MKNRLLAISLITLLTNKRKQKQKQKEQQKRTATRKKKKKRETYKQKHRTQFNIWITPHGMDVRVHYDR